MITRLSPGAIVLITGVAGFTGRHMAQLLHAEGMRVVGVARSAPAEPVAAVDELLLADLRDAVRAYWAIVQGGQAGRVYNVCSGTAVSIARLPGMLLAAAGVAAEVQSAEAGAGVRRTVGDASRLRGELGWRAQHTLEASLRDLLASWQARLRRELTEEPV